MRKKGANFLTFKGRGGRFQTDLDWWKIFLQWVIVLASQEKNQNQSRRKKQPFFWYFYSTTTQHGYAKPEQSNNILDSYFKTPIYPCLSQA